MKLVFAVHHFCFIFIDSYILEFLKFILILLIIVKNKINKKADLQLVVPRRPGFRCIHSLYT